MHERCTRCRVRYMSLADSKTVKDPVFQQNYMHHQRADHLLLSMHTWAIECCGESCTSKALEALQLKSSCTCADADQSS